MEKNIIYFDFQKSWYKLLLGLAIITAGIFIERGIFFLVSFIIGGSFVYFSYKSLSRIPQLIFSEDGLYIGFSMKKLIPWTCIQQIILKKKTVDLRSMTFISVTWKIKTNAPVNTLMREFPVGNLNISASNLQHLINQYLAGKSEKT